MFNKTSSSRDVQMDRLQILDHSEGSLEEFELPQSAVSHQPTSRMTQEPYTISADPSLDRFTMQISYLGDLGNMFQSYD
jgi:hypothetical protein